MKHATHRMHDNSVATYHSEEVKLSARGQAIYEWIEKHGPHTDREVMRGLGFSDMNAVRPRITELLDLKKFMEVGNVTCPVTKRPVRRVDVRKARVQVALFQ